MRRIKGINVRQIVFIFLSLVFVLYASFQARFLVQGPQVEITSPKNGSLISGSLLSIEGVAKNAAWITLNGRQIFTDEEGFWSEKMVVSPGQSTVTVETRDRFGREQEKSVQIMAN